MARPDKTIIDYLIIAVCPILIGLMAGSLAFFLMDCAYVGDHPERAYMIVGFFVLAMVGIARISIELSKGRAIVYGTMIAIEVLLVTDQLAPGSGSIVMLIIIVVWFGIHKLTWNCTMIDEQEEDVGRGLLEPESLEKKEAGEEDGSAEPKQKSSPWRRWLSWKYFWELVAEPEGKRHPPGAWVVYFAIVAVPIFTLAQWMIPPKDQASATKYVTVYLLSAMGLLLSTSLLGLRRYLRRRRAVMQLSMASAWLTLGAILIVVCIGLAMILPHPTGTVSERLASVRDSFTFREQSASDSRHNVGDDAATDSDPSDDASDTSEQKDDAKRSKPKEGSSKEGDSKERAARSSSAQNGSWDVEGLMTILRWILLALFFVAMVVIAYKHRRELLAALREIFESIRNFWANLFGVTKRREKREKEKQVKAAAVEAARVRFLELTNPFTSGQAERMPLQELVKYTFEAIEVWATDRQFARGEDQTPCQFLNGITRKTHIPTESLRIFSQAYSSTTYDTLVDTPETRSILLRHLHTIWQSISSTIHVA